MRHLPELLALAALLLGFPAHANECLHLTDPYARILTSGAGVVYFAVNNHADEGDTLISARTDIGMTMLMTSAADANGVMKMNMVMEGFAVGPGEMRVLQPAGDHVMLSDLMTAPKQGETFNLTLTFARAGDVVLTVPVDNARRTAPGVGPTPFDTNSDHTD